MAATVRLYLDTARLGRMAPGAQLAVADFAKFTGEAALTLYAEKFLCEGFASLSRSMRQRYCGLKDWRGIDNLKSSLLKLLAAPPGHDCLIAGRSSSLLRLAARNMAKRCRRVLVPDISWPAYAAVVEHEIANLGGETVLLPIRQAVFSEELTADDVMRRVIASFERHCCDGIFLTAVSHDGILMPTDLIIGELRRQFSPHFVLADAAQAVGQLPCAFGIGTADFTVAGAHKWLRAGLPLGISVARHDIASECMGASYDDPLLSLTAARGTLPQTETVNTCPLFSCQAAVSEVGEMLCLDRAFANRMTNRGLLETLLRQTPWQPVDIHSSLRSSILLAHRRPSAHDRADSNFWREHFHAQGISLTSFPGQILRLSPPSVSFSSSEKEFLRVVFTLE